MKVDEFGLEHAEDCDEPEWSAVVLNRRGRQPRVQRCRRCGLVWRRGDPAGPVHWQTGYARRGR